MAVSHLCIVGLNIHGISKHQPEYVRRIVKICIGYLPLPRKHATCNSKGTTTIHISLLHHSNSFWQLLEMKSHIYVTPRLFCHLGDCRSQGAMSHYRASARPQDYHLAPVFKIEALICISSLRELKLQPFSRSVGSNPRRQSENIETKYKTHINLVREWYGTRF